MRTSDVTQLMDLALGLWFPFVRIMAFLRYVPVLDNSALTVRVRIILSLALAIIITPLIPHPIPHDLLSLNSLILTVEQILWGMLFGLMFQFLFLALQLAGQILSFNMGMSIAVMNDPSSGASTTVLAELINVYAILLFFAMDGHLLLVSVLYKGFTYWPIGNALHPQTLRTIALAFSWVLASASLLALPTTFIMLIVQGCFGLLNRIAPPLNLFFARLSHQHAGGAGLFRHPALQPAGSLSASGEFCVAATRRAERSLWRIAAAKKKQKNPRRKSCVKRVKRGNCRARRIWGWRRACLRRLW